MSSNTASSSPSTVSMGQPLTFLSSSYPPSSSDGRFAIAAPLPFRKDGRANPEWTQGQMRRALTGEPLPPTNNGDDEYEASIRAATAMIAMRQRRSRQLSSTTGTWQPSAQSIFSFKRAFNATMAPSSRGIVLDSQTSAIAPSSTATTLRPAAADRVQTSSGGGGEGGVTPVDPAVRSRTQHMDVSERTASPRTVSWGEPLPAFTRSHQPRPDSPHPTRRHLRRNQKRGHGRSPVHHPDYDLGQPGRESDMVQVPRPDIGRLAASFLRVHDCAFVLRTDGVWTYAIVAEVLPPSSDDDNNAEEGTTSDQEDRGCTLRFVTDYDGSCKSISERKWGTHVRLIRSSSSRRVVSSSPPFP